MNFATLQYLIFFTAVFGVYWHLSRSRQNVFLCLASYFFYACWDWRFLSLIIVSTLVDFVSGRRIHLARSPVRRRAWLLFSLAVNLGILGYFKYFGFFADSLVDLAGALGWHLSRPTLDIILPVGISFYTFQTMSYSLDIYRGKLAPTRRLVDFAAFVAFFPQLVAGPIVRAREFVYQLERERRFSGEDLQIGLTRLLYGLFKKTFIADTIGVHLVDPVFAAPGDYGPGVLWFALLGYGIQIYADFSGYSSMAIGSARMLGFAIPENFAFPYLSRNISEFWRRWHMTMSRFFRDYVYIGLGGNRGGMARTLRNLAATTLVSGLWHGAGWTFLVWGGLHGLYLAVNQLWRLRFPTPADGGAGAGRRWSFLPAWLLTFLTVHLAWVLFRAPDFATAWIYLRGLVTPAGAGGLAPPVLVYWACAFFVVDHAVGWLGERGRLAGLTPPVPLRAAVYAAMVVFLFHARPAHVDPFIYFQF
jgi:alginate O-acetyltransferase complex protein AlgI